MRRNTLVLGATLLILAIFAWAGWANWEYRRQEAERILAGAGHGELVPAPGGGTPQYVSPLIGKPAPAFELKDLNGNKVSLANYRGKAVLINFWATWCGPCRVETPWIIELRNKYDGMLQLEASGGVTLETVRSIAETGVQRISVGAITHSAAALDIGLDIE